MKLNFKINVPSWLQNIILWPILLCYRLYYGQSARFIYIARFKFAVVDADLYERLRWYKWRLCRSCRTWYAFATVYCGPCRPPKVIWMHHLVLPPPPGLLIDHQNHIGLDNRLANLRSATPAQNIQNARKQKPKSTSKYKGVDFVKPTGKYRARIKVDGKRLFLGSFTDQLDAALAYDNAARKYFGSFACTNF